MEHDPRNRVVTEFRKVDLGDRRLNRRAGLIGSRLVANPRAGFPRALRSEAELEAMYRLANNDRVDLQQILAPHIANGHAVMREQGTALVLHDSTECRFPGEVPPRGIGYIGKQPGFILHTALAVSSDGNRTPLGVMGMMPIVRPKPQLKKVHWRTRGRHRTRESTRWSTLVNRVESQAEASLIHVMDREADVYRLLASLTKNGYRFVIRSYHDRTTLSEAGVVEGELSSHLHSTPFVTQRTVPLTARNNDNQPRYKKKHPSRPERTATLSVRAVRIRVKKPNDEPIRMKSLAVSVVQVCELEPPEGQTPVEWTLLTSEVVSTAEEILRVVDFYRARWRIEEYFRALKTGCAFTKRQFESLDALLRVLGFLAPVAWQLLALRSLAHERSAEPATTVLRGTQVDVLRTMGRIPLSEKPTVQEAFLAIAALGGHLRRNGPPGWITLGRGMEQLNAYERGWLAAMESRTCDQS